METTPHKSQNRWLVTIALLMVFGPIIWVSALYVTLKRQGETADSTCRNNLQQLGTALDAYAKAHDGKLPSAATWVDDLMPLVKDGKVFHCPADQKTGRSSYALNTDLKGDLQTTGETVLVYETQNSGDNPAGNGKDAVAIGRDTMGRHFHIANRYNFYLSSDLKVERDATADIACRGNLEVIAEAVKTYAQQHGGKLPAAKTWVDDLLPLVKDVKVFHCPADRGSYRSSYALNANFAGRLLSSLPVDEQTVLIYETRKPEENPSGIATDAEAKTEEEGKPGHGTHGRHFHDASRYNLFLSPDLKIHRSSSWDEVKALNWTANP